MEKKKVSATKDKKETTKKTVATKEAPKKAPASEESKDDRPKVYHISLREDGRWQVKFAKGERAVKTFATQAEAIEYAKKLADKQNGSITIHKKDGKIRKQKY